MAGSSTSAWHGALLKVRPQLEKRLKIEHHISNLHNAVAGGFLTDIEEQDISSQLTDYNRVRKLVEILITKDEKDIKAFAAYLKTIGQARLAGKLETAANEGTLELLKGILALVTHG